MWTWTPLILCGLNFCWEPPSNLTNKSQFSSLGLILPRPSFLHGELHTSAGSNQMSQIMGLIQSKLCTEPGEGGKKSCFWFFSALCRCSKCQACLHPQLTPLEFHKAVRGEIEREPGFPAGCFYRSTNKILALGKHTFLPCVWLNSATCCGAGCRNSQERRLVFVFLLFWKKPNQDFDFQK